MTLSGTATAGGVELAKINGTYTNLRAQSTTKGDVGLGSVANYGIATQAEAQAGTANNEYMTPLRVAEAISALVSNYSHPTGFSSVPATALSGASVISQVTVNSEGHVTGISSRNMTKANIGLSVVPNEYPFKTASTGAAGD